MLTGDKGDTAHHIAYSCGLYSNEEDFKVYRIEDKKTSDAVIDQITGLRQEAKYGLTVSATNLLGLMVSDDGKIKGERAEKVLNIIQNALSIVVFRCSSGQKALITRILMDNMKDSITLAIGDGANDVSMIQ